MVFFFVENGSLEGFLSWSCGGLTPLSHLRAHVVYLWKCPGEPSARCIPSRLPLRPESPSVWLRCGNTPRLIHQGRRWHETSRQLLCNRYCRWPWKPFGAGRLWSPNEAKEPDAGHYPEFSAVPSFVAHTVTLGFFTPVWGRDVLYLLAFSLVPFFFFGAIYNFLVRKCHTVYSWLFHGFLCRNVYFCLEDSWDKETSAQPGCSSSVGTSYDAGRSNSPVSFFMALPHWALWPPGTCSLGVWGARLLVFTSGRTVPAPQRQSARSHAQGERNRTKRVSTVPTSARCLQWEFKCCWHSDSLNWWGNTIFRVMTLNSHNTLMMSV